jgi:hypothetical protein
MKPVVVDRSDLKPGMLTVQGKSCAAGADGMKPDDKGRWTALLASPPSTQP